MPLFNIKKYYNDKSAESLQFLHKQFFNLRSIEGLQPLLLTSSRHNNAVVTMSLSPI